jgi:hypothetical protein
MTYLNQSTLDSISREAFQKTHPFPWTNPQGFVTDEGFDALLKTLPDVGIFESSFGMERAYGQKPHDRYELKYRDGLPISKEWQSFLDELAGSKYRAWISKLLGRNDFSLRFQWQYSFNGCSVSPHCDSRNKLASHLFYLNTPENWKIEWGGQTLILNDQGAFPPESAPKLEDFKGSQAAEVFGNRSLFFERTDRSWHAVSELTSPPEAMRKIFTVIVEKKPTLFEKIARKLKYFLVSSDKQG